MNAVVHALEPYGDTATALIAYLVTSLWMGALIVALVALLLRVWKPLDAAARYAVWYVALLAAALGPLATNVAPQYLHRDPATATLAAVTVAARAPRPSIAVPPLVAYGAAALWLLVVLGGSLRFVAGAIVLARLKRDALPLSPERRAALPLWRSRAAASKARHARLCVSDRVEVPVAVGLFDGMVVIPQAVLDAFESSDVDRFVLHELAHLERRDDWTTVVQRMLQVVMFFNPAVHVIARRLDLEREIACDDRVVAATSDVRSYAAGLTRMAEATSWPHRGIAAPAIFVTRRQLSLRVEELLSGHRFTARRIAIAPAAFALLASLGIAAAAAPLAPVIGLSAGTGTHAGELTSITEARFVLLDRRGEKTAPNRKPPRVTIYREFHTVGRIEPKRLDALIKAFEGEHLPPPQHR
jgi:bla regulator protein blaR1